jgi:hypothetical protein
MEGVAEPSFVETNLRQMEEDGINDSESMDALKFSAGALFSGGADTVGIPRCLNNIVRD